MLSTNPEREASCALFCKSMDDYLQSKTSVNSGASSAFSQQSTLINNNALVFNRGAASVDNDDFDKKFSRSISERIIGNIVETTPRANL
jgi:hypothetical protein